MATIDAALRAARATVEGGDAERLMAHVLGRPRGWLYAHGGDPLPGGDAARFEDLLARRAAGEPLAYLTGEAGFWSLALHVTRDTLIPRPDTETLVEQALARLPGGRPVDVLDMGTGTGAVALALASERPLARVVATDASEAALAVAKANAGRLGLDRVRFARGDWWAAVAGERFDLVASNPPYIAAGDPHLVGDGLPHEPAAALVSGDDGLDALRAIAAGASAHLRRGGWLLVEHGRDQGEAVRALFRDAGLDEVATARDLGDRERVTAGRLP